MRYFSAQLLVAFYELDAELVCDIRCKVNRLHLNFKEMVDVQILVSPCWYARELEIEK
jgi:hypothetical protein